MRRVALVAISLLCSTVVIAAPCGDRRGGYVFSVGDGHDTFSSVSAFPKDYRAIRHRLGDDFLWVRHGGKSYVIRDSVLLDRVNVLFAPVHALAPEERVVEREESELDHQIDEFEDLERPLTADEERRLDKLRASQEDVHRREHELDRRDDELTCQAETKMWPMVEEAIRSGSAHPVK